MPKEFAAAFATAIETPKIAFAPNFALFTVPSRYDVYKRQV